MEDSTKGNTQSQGQENTETTSTNTDNKENKPSVDVEKVKSDAIKELYENLGMDEESVKKLIADKRKEEDESKTELQKKDDVISKMAKEIASEKDLRMSAEAKLSAIEMGAKVELVDDLIAVAKSRVTKDKGIVEIITEIKSGKNGSVYFSDETEEEKEKQKNKNVTRGSVFGGGSTSKEDNKNAGTMAERILKSRKQSKPYYFK